LRAGLASLLEAAAEVRVTDPTTGGVATASVDAHDGTVCVRVDAGDPLDEVVLRSYCTGAAHQGLGWVATEGLAVDEAGVVQDLTVRSFGVLRAVDTPAIEVEVTDGTGPPVRVGDAVFAAVAGAAWVARGCPPVLPAGGRTRPA
ncbi:MAG: molybdopterin-dependent oxidoreductase, partial [Acidimicrobiia bacterium]|nr:molybdopterin-dependent oxidoreductase [Acidimicrobiia bacterium]